MAGIIPREARGAGGVGYAAVCAEKKTPDERSGVFDQVSRNKVTARKKQRKPRIGSGSLSSATGRTEPFVCVWGDASSAQLPRMRATVLDLLQL